MLTMVNIECHTPAGMPTTVLRVMMTATAGICNNERIAQASRTPLLSGTTEEEEEGDGFMCKTDSSDARTETGHAKLASSEHEVHTKCPRTLVMLYC